MKKQHNPTIKAHLIRSASYVLLLLGICLISFALAQRNTSDRTAPGALAGTHKPAPNIPASGQSQPVAPAAPSQAASTWMVAAPYPTTIVRYGFAQSATHFYVFGGVASGTRVNAVNRMDIATGMWQPRAPMPFTSEAPTCALMEATGIVYCTEGDTGTGFASYNIATDTWTPLASIPGTDHYGSASGAFNGKVFVAGGTAAFTNAVQVYDVATNTWSPGTAAPNGFLLAGYQQVGQFLYVVGGWTGGGPTGLTTTTRLDMSSAPGVWSTGPAFPMGRADFGLAYDAGTNKLYALGGDTQGGGFFESTNEVDELSVASWPAGTWTASPADLIPPNRQANQAGFYGAGDIWSVGGLDGATFQFLSEVQRRTNGSGGGGGTLLYGSTGGANASGGGRLWLIDVTNHSANLIGNTGFDRLGAIAFDSTGTLYGVSGGSAFRGTLMTINPTNGTPTVIGLLSDSNAAVDGLRFNSQGVLYGSSYDGSQSVGKLLTIDPSNANVLSSKTLVGSGNSFCPGIAFNSTNVLFASRGNASGRLEDIDLVDQVTGVLTPVGPMEAVISDIAFSPDGTLYGSSPTGDLYSINPVTGAKTLLFNTGITQLSGLAAPAASGCTVCHKRSATLVLPCNGLEYRRHLDHGDTLGPCPIP